MRKTRHSSCFYQFMCKILQAVAFAYHPVRENRVALGRIVDKNMRHSTDQPVILDDRTAAHALHDPAAVRKQTAVRHCDLHALAVRFVFVCLPC